MEVTPDAAIRFHFPARVKRLALWVLLPALLAARSWAHDATELTTRVYLTTNFIEVHVTVAAPTAMLLLNADEHPVAALASRADLEDARSFLNAAAGELFEMTSAGKPLIALATNVELSVEDHIEIRITYPRPGAGQLRFNAVHLRKLPAGEPYGALLTVVDLSNNIFLTQKLLTAKDPSLDVIVSPLPPARPPAQPRADREFPSPSRAREIRFRCS